MITEDTPGAPAGYKINTYAVEFPFMDMNPSVARALGLERFGLRFVEVNPNNTYVGPEGTQFSNYHSLDQTCASMAKLSRNDAEAWRRLMTSLFPLLDVGLPYLCDHSCDRRRSAATITHMSCSR